jgi:hypothetical protein
MDVVVVAALRQTDVADVEWIAQLVKRGHDVTVFRSSMHFRRQVYLFGGHGSGKGRHSAAGGAGPATSKLDVGTSQPATAAATTARPAAANP